MSSFTFDTHEFIKELKNAGFSGEQAEIITKVAIPSLKFCEPVGCSNRTPIAPQSQSNEHRKC